MSDVLQENIPSPAETIQDGLDRLRQKDWKQEFKGAGGLSTNPERVVKLMNSFTQGEVDVFTALGKRNMIQEGFRIPNTKLIFPTSSQPEDDYWAKCHSRIIPGEEPTVSLEIFVSIPFIEDLAKRDPEAFVYVREKGTDQITQRGRFIDFLYQIGAEEAAHAVYRWNHFQKRMGLGSSADQTDTLTKYDATPVEFHGLGWKIRGVMDRTDLPEDIKTKVLEPLQRRMREAIRHRQALKPPKETARAARARLKAIAEEK